jgi:hypothetical protein
MNAEETKQAAAVKRAKRIISQLLDAIPARRDWLNPVLEAEMKDFIAPEPLEVEVWVHPDGRICHDSYFTSSATASLKGFQRRRATIHPETK